MKKKFIEHLKKYPLPWVLGILIITMLALPLLLGLPSVRAFLQCYLAPLGSMRAQYLAVFATVVASFTAVMSAIMIQSNSNRKEKRENELKEKNNRRIYIRILSLYVESIREYMLENKNQPPIKISIDGWADYLSNISTLMLKESQYDKHSLLNNIFRSVERHNGFVERNSCDYDIFAKQEIGNINVDHITECIMVLHTLSTSLLLK